MWKRTLRTSILLLLVTYIASGCGGKRPRQAGGELAPDASAVSAAIAAWPAEWSRPFFMTVHAAGRQFPATGVLSHRFDVTRVTAITEIGEVLFDARVTNGQVTLDRLMPRLNARLVRAFAEDLSLAVARPSLAEPLVARDGLSLVRGRDARGRKYTWSFGPGGGLRAVSVRRGWFDELTVRYTAYDARGWPREMELDRPAAHYRARLTFTDAP